MEHVIHLTCLNFPETLHYHCWGGYLIMKCKSQRSFCEPATLVEPRYGMLSLKETVYTATIRYVPLYG